MIKSGASDHMTSHKFNLSSYKRFHCPQKVILGDNCETYVESEGKFYCYGFGDENDRVSNYAAQHLVCSIIGPRFNNSQRSKWAQWICCVL